MSNIEAAADIIYGYLECLPSCDTAGKDENGRCTDCASDALDIAYDLKDAGLLGKRGPAALDYTEPPHPTTLFTLEDHSAAPNGTIIVDEHGWPRVKDANGRWFRPADSNCCNYYAMTGPSEVLRWGWGKYDVSDEAPEVAQK